MAPKALCHCLAGAGSERPFPDRIRVKSKRWLLQLAEIKVFKEEETKEEAPNEIMSMPSPPTRHGNTKLSTDLVEDWYRNTRSKCNI